MVQLPDRFTQTVREVHGAVGAAWLDTLPRTIAACERRWRISVGRPFGNLSYNYVAPAQSVDGAPLVLKLGVPHPELRSEIVALDVYGGRGCVRLVASDPAWGALLLDRLVPGTPLSHLDDDAAMTSIAAAVMRRLIVPAPAGAELRSVADWASGLARLRRRFAGGTGPLPSSLVAQAEAMFNELLASAGPPVVLHGDLHHDNILAAGDGWLAIDPKGIIGEREYEVGALVRNRLDLIWGAARPVAAMRRRVLQLAEELGYDAARVHAWSLAQTVLSAWWSVEDHGAGWEGAIACAELLRDGKP